ncbi:MAG TPA: signal recognition particle protein [Candidatus Acidoferrales bacterium]|nr:signal recognition particle protein [Candidatus Acidoferrales bacterium]
MFEQISEKFDGIFRRLSGQARISEQNISDAVREVRRALLEGDVNYAVARKFTEEIQKKSIGKNVVKSLNPGQVFIKIVHDELVEILGATTSELELTEQIPNVIMVAGLQGSGKTTFAAKLANYLKSKGHYPLLVACDIHRPAAIDQLETLGQQISIPVYLDRGASAVDIAKNSVDYARKNARNIVIIDTAGRLHVDEEMMREAESVKDAVNPNQIFFVVDSMTGQDAVNTAQEFNRRLNFHGVVLTKLDGDARGGAAMSIRSVVQKPIKFVSLGEKLDQLEVFHPDRMASRILGMGDVVTLVEKVQEQVDEKQAAKLEQRIRRNEFTLEDFRDQLKQIKKMGPIKDILSMIPGVSGAMRNAAVDEKALVRIEAMISSMTNEERNRPNIIDGRRRKRIAAGSGTTVQDINKLLKQFAEMQKMFKTLSKGRFGKAALTNAAMRFPM